MISSDVNVMFVYNDRLDARHDHVSLFCMKNQRQTFLLFSAVKKSFIFTYARNLEQVAAVVDRAIVTNKAERKKLGIKRSLSSAAITQIVEQLVENKISEIANTTFLSKNTLRSFLNKILSNISIPELYNEDKALGEFREKYLENSEEEAVNALNKFIHHFKNFELMHRDEYNTYNETKDAVKNYFKKDQEDLLIAIEIFCYLKEFGIVRFLTLDKDMKKNLKEAAKKLHVKLELLSL